MVDHGARITHRFAVAHPAATIHGALVMAATLALMSDTSAKDLSLIGAAGVLVIYWLTHTYTHALSRGIGGDAHHLARRLVPSARHELGVLLGGVPALLTFTILVVSGARVGTAMAVGLWVTVVMMALFGYLAAHRAGVSGWRTGAETAFAALLGLLMVGLNTLLH